MRREDIFTGEAIAILARTIYGEARSQPYDGKMAVANVVLNRVKSASWWGDDIAEVCLWPLQFSAWNDRDPSLKAMLNAEDHFRLDRPKAPDAGEFFECLAVAEDAVAGRLEDNTFGSTHYINPAIANPKWARGLTPIVVIGDHAFYNNVP